MGISPARSASWRQSFYNSRPTQLELGRIHGLQRRPRRPRQPARDRPADRRELRAPLTRDTGPAAAERRAGSAFPDEADQAAPALGGHPTAADAPTWGGSGIPSPNTPIPIIKNEELILLHAEASIGLNDLTTATTDLNLIRTASGGLAPVALFATPQAAITELLYNKRYSLLYEGGHSWIDYRRYGRLTDLATNERPGPPPDKIFPTLPIPTAEVQAHQ